MDRHRSGIVRMPYHDRSRVVKWTTAFMGVQLVHMDAVRHVIAFRERPHRAGHQRSADFSFFFFYAAHHDVLQFKLESMRGTRLREKYRRE